jgi:hypothetical protein
MPTSAPSGYKISVSDNFSGTSLDMQKWFAWSGQPGGDPSAWWSPSQDVVSGGMLQVTGTRVSQGGNPAWTNGGEITGGIGSVHTQTYGEYEWCMKSPFAKSTTTAALLWPADNVWPPEVDLFENWGDPRFYDVWLHYGSVDHKIQRLVAYEFAAKWTVYLALWRPGNVQVLEDGHRVVNITNSNVPHVPMRFDLQTLALTPHASAGTTDVKWIVQFAPLTG